ncbi:MarR family winged helix-turn-helix transcriptional regulator [Streptomyces sp. NPDC052492]|uniref:Winged helix-turn-helix transcriptional regulator n=1 Tax=Streptomyces tendae TaxID=1932 RepID=A0ABX5ZUV4_STRTE|nr:MarR family winged helix-turn-helix transcriptional regulator [Streptomyces tendae]QER87527.1 winged helix-turn-helix transcriptional regulator [Streptomyces tendae]
MSGSETPASPPPEECPTGLQSFAVQLRRMTAEFNRIVQEFAQEHGLHHTDMQALIAILDAGGPDEPMTPGRLRKQLNLTSGAMTACLDRLERAGHIRRVRAVDDRRVVHLEYAERAKGLAREYFRPLARSTDAARERFTSDELRVVIRFLGELNQELTLLRRHGD